MKEKLSDFLNSWWMIPILSLATILPIAILPEIYPLLNMVAPIIRIVLSIILLAGSITAAIFMLRTIAGRLQDGTRKIGFAIVIAVLGTLVSFLLSGGISALLILVFRIPLSARENLDAGSITTAAASAILYPFLFCLPMTGLKITRFCGGFWGTYGRLIKSRMLPLFLIALAGMAGSAACGIYLVGWASVIISIIISVALFAGSIEIAVRFLTKDESQPAEELAIVTDESAPVSEELALAEEEPKSASQELALNSEEPELAPEPEESDSINEESVLLVEEAVLIGEASTPSVDEEPQEDV